MIHRREGKDSPGNLIIWPFIIPVLALLIGASFVTGAAPRAHADGAGSPAACLDDADGVDGSIAGTADMVTHTVEADQVVVGVCIKSGTNMFNGTSHSGVLGNGTYESECYEVSGVGTQTVTVERIGEDSPECQGISHIDVVWEEEIEEPEEPATLIVEKECIGTDDGTDFTINVSGGIGSTVLGCGESDEFEVEAGVEYTVSETPPDGWTGPNIRGACDGDGTVTLDPGETGTCVVQNVAEDQTATLIVEKECIGTDDGTDFTINVSGGIGSTVLGCGESDEFVVDADVEYTVSETPPDGWTGPNIRGLCDGDGTFTLGPDETGTCVVQNVAEEEDIATLIVTKECIGTDDGTDFTINVSGGLGSTVLGCGESDEFVVDADVEYTVSETPPDGWTGPNIRGLCDGDGTFTLGPDETGTCVVQNVAEEEAVSPAAPTVVVIEVQAQPPAAPIEATATPVAQVLGVQQGITPPNTGDGGLKDAGSSRGLTIPMLILAGATGLVAALSVRRFRHLKR